MTKTYLRYRTRITILACFVIISWMGLCVRLFQIQVLNGCGDKGIADLYASYLRDNSYDVIDYKNADHFNYNASQIIVHNNNLLVENIADLLFIPSSNIDYVLDGDINKFIRSFLLQNIGGYESK